jgi:hypothetical protein
MSLHLPPLNVVSLSAVTVRPAAENAIDGQDPISPLTVPVKVIAAALSVAVYVWPAIVTVPVRCGPLLAAMDKPTLPFPVPAAPELIAIHAVFDVADQAQPIGAVTDTVVVPPLDGNESAVRLSEYAHVEPDGAL